MIKSGKVESILLKQKTFFGIFAILLVLSVFALSFAYLFTVREDTNASELATDIDIHIPDSISIALSNSILNINITPSDSGTFQKDALSVEVSSNSPAGYVLTMSSATEDPSLKHSTNKNYGINSLAANKTVTGDSQADFTMNSYGYTITDNLPASTTFSPVKPVTNADTIKTSDAVGKTTTKVTFGTRADPGIPAGIYSGIVLFTAVPNQVPEDTPTFSGITYLQDMTADICTKETTPHPSATLTTRTHLEGIVSRVPEAELTDLRDGNTYIIRKLADGNCWMTENLRITSTASKTITLDSSDSNLPAGQTFTLPVAQTTTGTTWASSDRDATSVDTPHIYASENRSYGNFYNWHTATAGTGTYATISGNAAGSVCPKGWRLPEGSTSMIKSFGNLIYNYYGSNSNGVYHGGAILNSPISIAPAGYYHYSGSVLDTGWRAGLWSSTANGIGAYNIAVDTTNVKPQDSSSKAHGAAVRCVADTPGTFSDITYLQDMTASICSAETTPAVSATRTTRTHYAGNTLVPEAELIDKRDGERYTIRKLADGNCWMTQNLRLRLSTSKPLTSTDSDISAAWTPTYDTQTSTGTIWGSDSANEARSYIDNANREYGGYYTWYAATAGQGSYSISTEGQNTTSSICPKGWQLPEGHTSMRKSFGNLLNTYYGTNEYTTHDGAMLNSPFSVILTGFYRYQTGQVLSDKQVAYFWSSTVLDAKRTSIMAFNSTAVSAQDGGNYGKATGHSVRCVAR